jgi:hypothetical protein
MSEVLLPPDRHLPLPERLKYPEVSARLQRAQLLVECKHSKKGKTIRCESRYTSRIKRPFQAARVP